MRVAICISGYLRTWSAVKQSFIDNLLCDKDVQIDVFCKTYHQVDFKEQGALSTQEITNLLSGIPVRTLEITNDNIRSLTEEESLLIKRMDKDSPHPVNSWEHSFNGLITVAGCNQLRKTYEETHNFHYDLVVRTRFDVDYGFSMLFSKLSLTNQQIIIGYGSTFGYPNDMFAIAVPKIIDCYCCGAKDLVSIFSKDKTTVLGHDTLKYTIKTLSLKVSQVQIGMVKMNRTCCRYNIHSMLPPHRIFEYGKEFVDL